MGSLRRPCLTCGTPTPRGSYCPPHQAARDKAHNTRRASAPGNGAAARMRRAINRQGGAYCWACGKATPAGLLEVDHATALADGGHDVEGNVRPLCRPCHLAKTTAERRRREGR